APEGRARPPQPGAEADVPAGLPDAQPVRELARLPDAEPGDDLAPVDAVDRRTVLRQLREGPAGAGVRHAARVRRRAEGDDDDRHAPAEGRAGRARLP